MKKLLLATVLTSCAAQPVQQINPYLCSLEQLPLEKKALIFENEQAKLSWCAYKIHCCMGFVDDGYIRQQSAKKHYEENNLPDSLAELYAAKQVFENGMDYVDELRQDQDCSSISIGYDAETPQAQNNPRRFKIISFYSQQSVDTVAKTLFESWRITTRDISILSERAEE